MKKRILVIEDEPPVAKYFTTLLQRAGFEVDTAGTVHEGLAWIESTAYELIVLDLGLPDGPGTRVIRELQEGDASPPVLIVTGAAEGDPRITECLRLGAVGCVRKTAPVKSLLAAIESVFGK